MHPLLRFAFCLALCGTLFAAELDRPPPGAFTVVVIPDTQGYRGRATKSTPDSTAPLTNPVFQNHTRWIVENLRTQNIVFVSHVGDIVDVNNEEQWQLARECLDRLHGVVPYGLTVGNHDMKSNGDASLFQKYFPSSRYRHFDWYGSTYEHARPDQYVSTHNVNSYQLFSAGGLDFVHLNLECNAPDDVLAWADLILKRYRDRRALVTTHMDLGPVDKPRDNDGFVTAPKGRMNWVKIHGVRGNSPVQLWDKLFSRHAHLGFIFSGDQSRTTALRLAARGQAGNTVHSLLSDYTSSGPLRLYRFVPTANQVQAITYDTTRHEIVTSTRYVPDRAEHQFTLPYLMTESPAARLR
ncbi:MAG: serine/threonine protein phosphatase [Verrucomicrobia bacterium]|nr:serine/threonine protein phosphatase [Verrucomicrobiota bacterium]